MDKYFRLGIIILLAAVVNTQLTGFDVNVAELNGIRMVSTSDQNYAITNPNFAQNWRTVSVNGDDVIISTKDNNVYTKTLTTMTELERNELSNTKSQVSQVIQFNGIHNGLGGSNSFSSFNMNNNNIGNQQAKFTTYSSSGSHMSSSSSSSSSMGGNNQMSHYSINDMSFSMSGDNDFAIYRKDKMPFNWSRVFVNGDLLTIVLNNGQVYMKPMAVASAEEVKQLELLRSELKTVAQIQQQQFSQNMQNSMNMMQTMMGNNFQPNYQIPTNSILPTPQANQLPPVSINPANPMNTMNPMNYLNTMNPTNQMNPFNPQQFHDELTQQILYQQQLLQQQILQQLNQQFSYNQNPHNYRFNQRLPLTQAGNNMLNSNSNLFSTTQYPNYFDSPSPFNNSVYREQTDRDIMTENQTQQQNSNNLASNSLRPSPSLNLSYYPGNLMGQFNPTMSATTAGGLGSFNGGMFGNNFPFGSTNSPFGNGFPFNNGAGASAFSMAGR